MNSNIKYLPFDHPSDIGLTIFGESLKQLFENAAFALFDNLCNLQQVKEASRIIVNAQGNDREELLVNFLNELLYLQSVKGWLIGWVEIQELNNDSLKAIANGDKYNMETHEIFHEIKCATYHDLHIRKEKNRWRVDVVFDV